MSEVQTNSQMWAAIDGTLTNDPHRRSPLQRTLRAKLSAIDAKGNEVSVRLITRATSPYYLDMLGFRNGDRVRVIGMMGISVNPVAGNPPHISIDVDSAVRLEGAERTKHTPLSASQNVLNFGALNESLANHNQRHGSCSKRFARDRLGPCPAARNDIQPAQFATLPDGGLTMQEPAVFKVVSGDGEVHAENLSSTAAFQMASFLVTNRNLQHVRTEPMATPVKPTGQIVAPHIVATATPLPHIEPGKERTRCVRPLRRTWTPRRDSMTPIRRWTVHGPLWLPVRPKSMRCRSSTIARCRHPAKRSLRS